MQTKATAASLRPFISFCHCGVESKKGTIIRMKHWKTALAILAVLSASIALADDFKTIDGKEYKKATVSRVVSAP
jgi:hypothetical protein